MSRKALLILACVLLGLTLFVATGCSEEAEEDAATTEASDAVSETEGPEDETAAEGGAEGSAVLVGTWENADGGVFRVMIFREDGTADTVNYAEVEDVATWSLEDDYLKVETAGGETYGSPIEWVSETEFAWAYESGTWAIAD